MNSTETQQASNLGVEARNVLDNPAFQEAMRLMREDAIRAIKEVPIRDKEGQTLMLQAMRLTDKVEAVLRGILEAGESASKIEASRINIDSERTDSLIGRGRRKLGI